MAEIDGGAVGASYVRSLRIDEPFIRQTSSTGNEYFHSDALGSSLALSNASGATDTIYTYEPFGETRVSGISTNSFRYTSREGGDLDGLYYYRERYYNSHLRRFLQEDPLDLLGGDYNLYSYVYNNPVNWVDPLGLAPSTIGGDDPGFSDPEKTIKELEEKLKDPSLCQRDKEKIKRRIKELRRRPSKKQQHHYEGGAPPVVVPPLAPVPLPSVPSPGVPKVPELPPVVRIPVFVRPIFVFP